VVVGADGGTRGDAADLQVEGMAAVGDVGIALAAKREREVTAMRAVFTLGGMPMFLGNIGDGGEVSGDIRRERAIRGNERLAGWFVLVVVVMHVGFF